VPPRLRSVEIVQIDEISRAACSSLHPTEIFKPAYGDRDAGKLDVDRAFAQVGIVGHARQPLDHVEVSDLRGDQSALTFGQ
jgi:hypothetical protein